MRRLRALLLALALALLPGLAAAQSSTGGFGGYTFPRSGPSSGECSPLCTTAAMEWRVPTVSYTGSGGGDGLFIWLGIMGSTSSSADSNNCPGSFCIGQFGTGSEADGGGASHYAWYELYCPNGAGSTPIVCQPVVVKLNTLGQGTYNVAAGDRMVAAMACVSGCSPAYSTSAKWAVSLQNVTAGWIWTNGSPACTTGAQTSCFNWPLGQSMVAFVAEAYGTGAPIFDPVPVTNLLINGATPVFTNIKQGAVFNNKGSRAIFPSQLTNGGSSFYICRAAGSYSASSSSFFCANGGGYAGAGGLR